MTGRRHGSSPIATNREEARRIAQIRVSLSVGEILNEKKRGSRGSISEGGKTQGHAPCLVVVWPAWFQSAGCPGEEAEVSSKDGAGWVLCLPEADDIYRKSLRGVGEHSQESLLWRCSSSQARLFGYQAGGRLDPKTVRCFKGFETLTCLESLVSSGGGSPGI